MAGWTNRGKARILNYWYRREGGLPNLFYLALVTGSITPTAATNVLGDLQEIAVGSGYSAGGVGISPDTESFVTFLEDDGGGLARLGIADYFFLADGGQLPVSGGGARWVVMLDDNATPAQREVLHYWSLESDRIVPAGSRLVIETLEISITE